MRSDTACDPDSSRSSSSCPWLHCRPSWALEATLLGVETGTDLGPPIHLRTDCNPGKCSMLAADALQCASHTPPAADCPAQLGCRPQIPASPPRRRARASGALEDCGGAGAACATEDGQSCHILRRSRHRISQYRRHRRRRTDRQNVRASFADPLLPHSSPPCLRRRRTARA